MVKKEGINHEDEFVLLTIDINYYSMLSVPSSSDVQGGDKITFILI